MHSSVHFVTFVCLAETAIAIFNSSETESASLAQNGFSKDKDTYSCVWAGPVVDNVLIFVSTTTCLASKNPQLPISPKLYNRENYAQVKECLAAAREKSDQLAEFYDLKSLKNYTIAAEQLVAILDRLNKTISEKLICHPIVKLPNLNEETKTYVDLGCEAFKFIALSDRNSTKSIVQQICSDNHIHDNSSTIH